MTRSLVLAALLALLPGVLAAAEGEEEKGWRESIPLECKPTTDVRVIPPGAKGAEITVSDCICFDSAGEATQWLKGLAANWKPDTGGDMASQVFAGFAVGETVAGGGAAPLLQGLQQGTIGAGTKSTTLDLKPGEQKEVSYFCYSRGMVQAYFDAITAATKTPE